MPKTLVRFWVEAVHTLVFIAFTCSATFGQLLLAADTPGKPERPSARAESQPDSDSQSDSTPLGPQVPPGPVDQTASFQPVQLSYAPDPAVEGPIPATATGVTFGVEETLPVSDPNFATSLNRRLSEIADGSNATDSRIAVAIASPSSGANASNSSPESRRVLTEKQVWSVEKMAKASWSYRNLKQLNAKTDDPISKFLVDGVAKYKFRGDYRPVLVFYKWIAYTGVMYSAVTITYGLPVTGALLGGLVLGISGALTIAYSLHVYGFTKGYLPAKLNFPEYVVKSYRQYDSKTGKTIQISEHVVPWRTQTLALVAKLQNYFTGVMNNFKPGEAARVEVPAWYSELKGTDNQLPLFQELARTVAHSFGTFSDKLYVPEDELNAEPAWFTAVKKRSEVIEGPDGKILSDGNILSKTGKAWNLSPAPFRRLYNRKAAKLNAGGEIVRPLIPEDATPNTKGLAPGVRKLLMWDTAFLELLFATGFYGAIAGGFRWVAHLFLPFVYTTPFALADSSLEAVKAGAFDAGGERGYVFTFQQSGSDRIAAFNKDHGDPDEQRQFNEMREFDNKHFNAIVSSICTIVNVLGNVLHIHAFQTVAIWTVVGGVFFYLGYNVLFKHTRDFDEKLAAERAAKLDLIRGSRAHLNDAEILRIEGKMGKITYAKEFCRFLLSGKKK